MTAAFGKKTKGCFSSKARFSAVVDAFCSSKEIATAHRAHGVCPARLAAFFSEERGCAALSQEPAWGLRLFAALAPPGDFFGEIIEKEETAEKRPPPLAVGGGHVAVFAAPPWWSRRSFADTAGGLSWRSFLVFQFGG